MIEGVYLIAGLAACSIDCITTPTAKTSRCINLHSHRIPCVHAVLRIHLEPRVLVAHRCFRASSNSATTLVVTLVVYSLMHIR